MREIQLTQGYVALVDDGDFVRVSAYKWHAHVERQNDEKTALKATESGAVIDYRDWLVKRINRKRKTNVLGIS
jgi:protein associated with RNAse G/E